MDHEVLKEMEKALEGNKTLQKLTLDDDHDDEFLEEEDYHDDYYVPLPNDNDGTLPKEFCRHLMIGIGLNTSLSEVHLKFYPYNWDCPIDGRLVYVSHMLCDSVGCSV